LGRTLFGAAPTLREQFREWPRLFAKRAGLSLLWGRFSGVRSFTMPVVILEGLSGKSYRERTAVLKQHGGSSAFGLTSLFGVLEMAVIMGCWWGIRAHLPAEYSEWLLHPNLYFNSGLMPPVGLLWSLAACVLVEMAVLGPFYAAGGFGLYINSRTHLEGWDVDLTFRQMGARLRKISAAAGAGRTGAGSLLSVLLLGCGFVLLPALPVRAADKSDAARQIQEVVARPEFKEHIEKKKEWEWDRSTPAPAKPEGEGWDWGWLKKVGDAVTRFFSGSWKEVLPRLLGALAIAAALTWLGWWLFSKYKARAPRMEKLARDAGPRLVMGLEVTPESLPPDVAAAAWKTWQDGDAAGAVRLLYRGALAWLMEQGTVPIRAGDTEGDCLAHAGALPDPGRRDYFHDLTGTWLAAAYGNVPPESATMRALCDRWPFALTHPDSNIARPFPRGPGRGAGLICLLLLSGFFLTGCSGKFVEREKEIGHLGEARRDPWLAATEFLRMNQLRVIPQRGVLDLPDPDAVLVVPAESIHSAAIAKHVMNWTERGGHLVYIVQGGGAFQNDWSGGEIPILTKQSRAAEAQPLLELLGIPLVSDTSGVSTSTEVMINDTEYKVSMNEHRRLDLTNATLEPDFFSGAKSTASIAGMESGYGRITVLADGRPFRNRWIDDDDNAAFLLALTELPGDSYHISFVKGDRTGLWEMLMEHAWTVMVAAGVLLAVWLWSVLPRIGPVRPVSRSAQRQFATHLDESGAYLWRQRLTEALLEFPRKAVITAARHHAMRDGERGFVSDLARRTGLPADRVQDALHGGNQHDARHFIRQAADLQTLLSRLRSLPPSSFLS
ncbi:MAG: hypothetical protein JWL81_3225, partial [Verrucomicrobiales bacterium]|nr:hypothetical protein [Verrucomicrobiales bacterium]